MAVFGIIMVVISLFAYAASEMVLKKTFNVFYAWKGYVGFLVFFAALIGLFSLTSVFGYETRVPEKADVDSAVLYNYYYTEDEPFTKDSEIIDMILKTHLDFVNSDSIPKIKTNKDFYISSNTRIHIKYNLKNGKTMYRTYPVSYEKAAEIMNALYENEDYKKLCEDVFIEDSRITKIYANHEQEIEDYKELLKVLREDVMAMSYEQLHPKTYDYPAVKYTLRIEYTVDEVTINDGKPYSSLSGFHIDITDNYEKTINWLKEKGYDQISYE